jgi:hypothetical protein
MTRTRPARCGLVLEKPDYRKVNSTVDPGHPDGGIGTATTEGDVDRMEVLSAELRKFGEDVEAGQV